MKKLVKHLHLPRKVIAPPFDNNLQAFLSGRIWLEEELPFLEETLRYHKHQKMILQQSGIEKNACVRCGSHRLQRFHCSKCKSSCQYCLSCLNMRRVSSCSNLISWCGPKVKMTPIQDNDNNWQLTAAQQAVANKCLTNDRDFLIHAVTGAGKTEILFPIIEYYLKRGKRICVATPRTDVVLELFPRFKSAFPNILVQALYGGSHHDKKFSPLVIATTHQLIRFEAAFDLVIVDESDAFPYSYDRQLVRAVQKAKKSQARTILMTATPDLATRRRFEKTQSYAFLARRFHGADLPVPRYSSLWNYDRVIRKGRLPNKLKQWVQNCLKKQQPFLVFFPTIALMMEALPLFQMLHKKIKAVHAAADDRKKSIRALREEKIPGLLTTTILERGITIPNVQVAVVGAESRIFTASALVQISGRVGRSKQIPIGDIVFFHHGMTWQMDEALHEIKRLNNLGQTK